MSKNLSWIWSGALIGQRGSYIVLAIVYKQQTEDKGPNENVMNLLQKGQYSWNIAEVAFKFCWSSFAEEHKTLPESTRRIQKSNKFSFGTPWLSDLLCKHWFTSSVWNFCRWDTDVPLGETSALAARSKERLLFSQASEFWSKALFFKKPQKSLL